MNSDSGASGRAGLVRATVMVGDVETHYRRAGVGPVLLILRELAVEQLMALALHSRVIVPDSTTIGALAVGPAGERPFSQWLSGFLEGLGVTAATILAPATLASELCEVAEAQPGVIRRVVLFGVFSNAAFPAGTEVSWAATDAELLVALS